MAWNPETKKWEVDVMDDAALDPDSLVGRMRNVKPTSNESQIRNPEPLPPMEAPLPLWRAMEKSGMNEPGSPRDAIAAEIEALRDVMLPEEPAMHIPNPVAADDLSQWAIQLALHRQRREFREYLTKQAQLARQAGPD